MATQGIVGSAPAPAPDPAPVAPQGVRTPTTLGYWLAVAIVVAGFIGAGVLAVATGIGAYDRLTDPPAPRCRAR